MQIVLNALFLVLVGWFLAQMEINVEGDHGWAEKLPTWRYDPAWLLRITNGKPLTGYHLYLNLILLALMHWPLFFVSFSRSLETKIASVYCLLAVVWDFQWFAWNPAWGVRRFMTQHVWWLPKKLFGFPVDYYFGIASSAAITALFSPEGLSRSFFLIGCALGLTLCSAGIAGAVVNYK